MTSNSSSVAKQFDCEKGLAMSNYALLFPSKWLAAADMDGDDRVVVIKQIVPSEEVGQSKDKRPVLYFQGVSKGMVLNKTNAKRIAKLYGADTDKWIGKSITLYPSECDFGDETVPCLRVRPEAPQAEEPDDDAGLDEEELAALEAVRKRKAEKKAKASATAS
jgi:hypothetical protein